MNRLEEIRAREQAATPGPWSRDVCFGLIAEMADPLFIEAVYGLKSKPLATINESLIANTKFEARLCNTPDEDFITHARADIPFLLGEVERLTAEKDMCEKQAIRYQNEWIRRGQEIDRLTAELEKYRAAKNPSDWPTQHHHISEPENCDECRKQFIEHDLIRFCANCKHYKGKKDGETQ